MAVITGINNGSLKEVMDQSLVDLKVGKDYLSAHVGNGGDLDVLMANNRGYRIAIDYTRNNSLGYMDPDGGNLTATMKPALDNMTMNLQYLQFGQEISALQLANSAAFAHVGPTAKALAAEKMLTRRAEIEEFYFCRGAGTQVIGDVTATATVPVVGVQTTVTCSGARDGLGTYILGVGQNIRILDASNVFKSSGSITAKTSNTTIGYTPAVVTTATIVDTDQIFPESDSTTATTTGVKGLPYLIKTSGSYFDKSLSTVTALKGVVDASTTTFTRTTMEALYRNSQMRVGANPKQVIATGLAQYSNYYAQFYAQNTAQVNIINDGRPGIDVGGNGTMNSYTFWGQKINQYQFIHPKNWWLLDYSTFSRLSLKAGGAMQTPAGDFVQKISGGVYANAQQSWDDNFIEYISDQPFRNAGFTSLAFSGLPGLLNSSSYTGS